MPVTTHRADLIRHVQEATERSTPFAESLLEKQRLGSMTRIALVRRDPGQMHEGVSPQTCIRGINEDERTAPCEKWRRPVGGGTDRHTKRRGSVASRAHRQTETACEADISLLLHLFVGVEKLSRLTPLGGTLPARSFERFVDSLVRDQIPPAL